MIRRTLMMAGAVIAAVVTTACSDGTTPTPLVQSGALNVTKECSAYTGHAGDFCTITSSSLTQIEVGSRVVYASDAVGTSLDTDVVLNQPAPGTDTAFGHCALSLETGVGQCTFSGGTGRFTSFHATVAVSHLDGPNYAWTGTYDFSSGS
jgi:hypothetical protein